MYRAVSYTHLKEKLLTTSFMGKEAKFPMGPFLLASKLKVPVVFYLSLIHI